MTQRIKDWEIETGVKIKKPKGFKGRKSTIYNRYYTRSQFKRYAYKSIISVKTQKGLEFLKSEV